MALTREQYDEIMRTLNARRTAAMKRQQEKQEAVENSLPALPVFNRQIAALSEQEVRARLQKDGETTKSLHAKRAELIAARQQLLRDAGYDESYLEPDYTCPLCRDTGYVGNEKCGCMRQLESELLNRAAGLPELLAMENFRTFDINVFDDEVLLEELPPDSSLTQRQYMQEMILPRIKKYRHDFETPGSHNIFLFGPPGTGKTFLSNCIARELIERQHTVIYERADSIFGVMSKENFAREKDEANARRIERLASCELLILDDLGSEFMTEYTKSMLFSIISNRLSEGVSTIISSNLSLNQIRNIYGERIASRLVGEYMLIPLLGTDLRNKR